METLNLLKELDPIINRLPSDFGGGSPRDKLLLMCYLAYRYRVKTYVEIGVYRGRSFFPVAHTVKMNQGMSFGIDPYCKERAYEADVGPELQKAITKFVNETDYDLIYQEVEQLRKAWDLSDNCQIQRKTSESAVDFFSQNHIPIDMLHIDGNHDTCFVKADVAMYLPLVSPKGFIVMDDTDWESVKPAHALAQMRATLVLEAKSFAILLKDPQDSDVERMRFEILTLYRLLSTSSVEQ